MAASDRSIAAMQFRRSFFFKSFSAEINQPFSLLCLFWSVLVEAAS